LLYSVCVVLREPWIHLDPLGRLFNEVGILGPAAAAGVLILDYVLTSILARDLKRALRLSVGLAWLYLVISAARCFTPSEATDIAQIFRVVAAVGLSIAVAQTVFVLVVDFVLGRNGKRPIRPLLRYGLLGVVFLVAALAGLRAGGVTGSNVLISGAVVIGGVGAAVAEVLRQVGAGILVQYARPFEVGDVVQVLPLERHGVVIGTNWRTTTLRGLDGVEMLVPNNDIVTHTVVNLGHGDRAFRRTIVFEGMYDAAPDAVRSAVLAALRDAPGIEATPEPEVLLQAFGDSGIRYAIRYWTRAAETFDQVDADVRQRVWYAFSRANLGFPFPTRTLHLAERSNPMLATESRAAILKRTLLFSGLSEEAVLDIALFGREEAYGEGELIVRAGDEGTAMHILIDGEVVVQAAQDRRELFRLFPGQFFGEMSLITGAPRTATVVAVRPSRTFVLDEPGFRAMVTRHDEIADALGEVLAARQSELTAAQDQLAADSQQGDRTRVAMIARIKRVFGLLDRKSD